jgi:hypothetical protein
MPGRVRVQKFVTVTPLSESRKSVATPTGRVYKGVTLIKSGLGNKRDKNYYPPETLQEGVRSGLFEGLRAFADHPDSVSEEIQPERSIRDMVGVYENAKYDSSNKSVRADLRILKSHDWLSGVIDELIEAGHGDKIGLSINGRGETEAVRRRLEESGEEQEVNELKRFIELRSTDVVTEAGAGGGFSELLESARRAKESRPMVKKSEILAQLREAVRKGKLPKAKELEQQYTAVEEDAPEGEEPEEDEATERPAKEMGGFAFAGKGKKKKGAGVKAFAPVYEAKDKDDEDESEDDEPDDDAKLDEAADEQRRRASATAEDVEESEDDEVEESEDDEDEDGDEVEEADEDEEAEPDDKGADTRRAADKFRHHQHKERPAKEAAIKSALGKPTGTITSGDGRFTKPAKGNRKGGKVGTRKTKGFSVGRMPGRARESRGSTETLLAMEREKNRRLRESIARQESVNLATKVLRESNLPKAVRPHLLRDLIGLTKQEMLAEINKQASILEAAAASAVERLTDDFDDVEGAGTTTIRESFYGGRRGDGDDLGDLLAESGLPMKR